MIGSKVKARLDALGMTQTELASEVGVTQGTIASLISGRSNGSKHLHKIARALRTSPEYLLGETDVVSVREAPTEPAYLKTVVMHVAMPSHEALTAMFNGLLRNVDLTLARGDIARQLAELLPIGLATLEDLRPDPLEPPHTGDHASAATYDAMRHPVPQP